MVDEAHVTTFAVLPAYRRRGIGGLLLTQLMAKAMLQFWQTNGVNDALEPVMAKLLALGIEQWAVGDDEEVVERWNQLFSLPPIIDRMKKGFLVCCHDNG